MNNRTATALHCMSIPLRRTARPSTGAALFSGKAFYAAALLMALAGCLTSGGTRPGDPGPVPAGHVRRFEPGFTAALSPDGRVMIGAVMKDSPAEKAGLRRGGIVLSIDGKPVSKRIDVLESWLSLRRGERIQMTVLSAGRESRVTLTAEIPVDEPTDVLALRKALNEERPVRLAVIVTGVSLGGKSPQGIDTWKEGVKHTILGEHESLFLSKFSDEKSFAIVDRARLAELLKEEKLQQVGLVSGDSVSFIGKALGATHILFIDFGRFPTANPSIMEDRLARRLVQVMGARVLSSLSLRTKIDSGGGASARPYGCVSGDCVNGRGTFLFLNGDRYTGQFRGGKYNGTGAYYHSNGDRHSGSYAGGKRNGPGTYHYARGDRFEGMYRNDLPEGKGTYYFRSGMAQECLYEKGRMVRIVRQYHTK